MNIISAYQSNYFEWFISSNDSFDANQYELNFNYYKDRNVYPFPFIFIGEMFILGFTDDV